MADFMGSPATTLLPQDPEALRLQRQRMLAEALLAQSQQPINPNRMSGRFMSAISPLEGLAKMVQAGVGAYSMRKADDRMQEMSDQRRQALVRALRGEAAPGSVPAEQFSDDAEMARMPGPFDYSKPKPASLRDPMTESVVGVTAPAVPVRGRLPQDAPPAALDPMQTMRNEVADMLESNSISPAEARAFMLQMRKSELDRNADLQAKLREPRVIPEGGRLVTGTGEVVAEGAAKRRAPDLVDSGGPRDAQGNPTTIKMVIGEDGVARPIPGVQPVSRGPLATATSKVQNILPGNKGVKDAVDASVAARIEEINNAAAGAPETLRIVSVMRNALSKAILGTGANVRLALKQIASNMGFGTHDEALAKTQQVISGLAKITLSKRGALKGQGAITDKETKLLEDAESGQLENLSVPQLREILDAAERASRLVIQKNNRNLELIKKGADPLQFMQIDEPPVDEPPKSGYTIRR